MPVFPPFARRGGSEARRRRGAGGGAGAGGGGGGAAGKRCERESGRRKGSSITGRPPTVAPRTDMLGHMSNHYPPQGMPQSQPFGQPQFAQQPPAGFPPPGPGVPLRPHGPGLANNKRFLVAGLLGAGVILSLLVLFLPYLTASGGRKKTATLSDVADGFKDPSFVLVLIATIAAAAALVPLFLDYRRVPPPRPLLPRPPPRQSPPPQRRPPRSTADTAARAPARSASA